MKRVVPLMLMGALTMIELPVFSAPLGAYYQVMQAVYARDEAGLKYLVSVGLNVNATNMQGKTALCTAVENQDYEGYELLLSQGATTRTPCMRNMNPEVLSRFLAEQPPLGTYYEGAVLTASRNGALASGAKDVATTVGSLPYPHLGEILLAGVAVGTAFAVGVHGGGGGDSPVPPSGYESPFDNTDSQASNYLSSTYFSAPTVGTLSSTQKGGIEGVTEDLVKAYTDEYAGGKNWTYETETEIVNQKVFDFLSSIKASDAYARGYSGYKINRDMTTGKPVGLGWDAVTNARVQVAVMDTGQYYNTDLYNVSKTGIEQDETTVYGLNYVYGTTSNSSYYWNYGVVTGSTKETANLYKGTTLLYSKDMSEDDFNRYAGQFARVCEPGEATNCLSSDETEDAGGYYTVSYVTDLDSVETTYTYYIYPEMWELYKDMYGETGYVYGSDTALNAFGSYFETQYTSSELSPSSHGTHVAGIIAALRNGQGMQGVAYNAQVIPVRLDFDMGQTFNHISDIVNNYPELKIINLSIGPAEEEGEYTLSNYTSNLPGKNASYFSGLELYYQAAADNNIAMIFSSGNGYIKVEGTSPDETKTVVALPQASIFSAAPLVDSAYKNLSINVVALGDNNKIASYSNRCGATAEYCLAAPGGESLPIMSTGLSTDGESSYTVMRGTSMATPMVSGSLAVVMGAFPFLTTQQAVQILLKTATYIKPTDSEIAAYNTLAKEFDGSENAYAANTVEGTYNAIYGRGLVNLEKATSPIGLPKITFDTKATSTNSVVASASSAHISAPVKNTLKALPKNLIVLDDYSRAYQMPTRHFFRTEKRTDSLRRSFRSFMAHDEKEVGTSDVLSFAFTKAPSDRKNVQTGSMSMVMRPNKNLQMRLGFTEDTASFGGSYVGRSLQNPFMNMRQAFGADASVRFAKNWTLTGGWYSGKNGFIDEDIFDKMSKQPHMQLIESGLTYQGIKNMTLGVSGGIMNEEDSLFGARGSGAFKTSGAQTQFVRVMANYQPIDRFRLSGAYTYGMTEANRVSSLMQFSRLTSDSFSLAAEYIPDDKQTFGIKLMSPLRIRSGSASFNLPVARDLYEDRVYRGTYTAGLKSSTREYDLSLFYANELSDDLSLAGETGLRLHPDHQQDVSPDYRALFKLNWKW